MHIASRSIDTRNLILVKIAFLTSFLTYIQSVKLHYAVTFQMLHWVMKFENVTFCCHIALLQHDVTL